MLPINGLDDAWMMQIFGSMWFITLLGVLTVIEYPLHVYNSILLNLTPNVNIRTGFKVPELHISTPLNISWAST
jgi:hypothetical protein